MSLTGEAQQPTTGGNGADLELSTSSTNGNPGQWQFGSGRFTLTNTGTSAASGITVMLRLPSAFVYEGGNEATASQGAFNPYSNPQPWSVGSLAAGASASLEVNLFYMTTGSRRMTAWVSAQNATEADSQAGNGFGNGEDDEACFEFQGRGACASSSARVAPPTNFHAAVGKMEVETYWNIDLTDLTNRDYVVERNTQGRSWELIGTKLPTADATLHVWDASPAFGLNRYRLSTRNADGSIREQSIREVSFDVDASVMQVNPNPVADRLTIFTPSSEEYKMEIQLYKWFGSVDEYLHLCPSSYAANRA